MTMRSNRGTRRGQANRYAGLLSVLLVAIILTIPATWRILNDMLLDQRRDTVALSFAAFGILGVLATGAFNYASVLKTDGESRQRAIRAGEYFFLASIIFAAASLLKHALLGEIARPHLPQVKGEITMQQVFEVSTPACFLLAFGSAYLGSFEAVQLLAKRFYHPDA